MGRDDAGLNTPDSTTDGGSTITLSSLGIGWITKLKKIATVGPVTWFQKRFVEFILAFLLGSAARIAGVIEGMWLWFARHVGGGTLEVWEGAGYIGSLLLGFLSFVLGAIQTATAWAGPLAPLVWAILVALVVMAVYRIGKALLTLIPGGEALMTLVTG